MSRATKTKDENDAVFRFAWGESNVVLRAEGTATIQKGRSHRRVRLQITDGKYHRVNWLYTSNVNDNLLVVADCAWGDEGYGTIALFDGNRLTRLWSLHIPAFNVGKPLLDGRFAYLSAIGFIAKVDLVNGKFIWRHDDLYKRDEAFNDFDEPVLDGPNVVFVGSGTYGSPNNEIVVNKDSGQIIAIRPSS